MRRRGAEVPGVRECLLSAAGRPHLWKRTTTLRSSGVSSSHSVCEDDQQVAGEGPVDLVYATGWFSNLEAVWEVPDLSDFLGELASAFRLILLDRRGFGLSDWPITSGGLSMELGMDDIRAVMDAAGSERAVLFGFDDGGAICTLFAASKANVVYVHRASTPRNRPHGLRCGGCARP